MEKAKKPCLGKVREIRKGKEVTYKLICNDGDCDEGKCDIICTKPDDHGTYIEYCGCPGGERTCNIYIETDGRGNKRIDCFTLGCGEGQECTLVEGDSVEGEGGKATTWFCACKPIGK